jgi:hypothetical protein
VKCLKKVLSKVNTELLSGVLELVEVLLVLLLVLDLNLETLKDSDGSGVVVNSAAGLESSQKSLGGGDQVIRENVVENSLDLVEIVGLIKLLVESAGMWVSTGLVIWREPIRKYEKENEKKKVIRYGNSKQKKKFENKMHLDTQQRRSRAL